MDPLAPAKAFDRLQRRHAPLAVPIAVLRKFSDDQAGNAAALMAYWGFFSIFPLLLLFVTVLGFVLEDNPSAQESITNSVLTQVPVVGFDPTAITGNTLALVVGLVGALLAGLGVTTAAQNAFNLVYAVPHRDRPDFFMTRLRGLEIVLVVGVLQVLSSALSGLVSSGLTGFWLTLAGFALSLLLNLLLFFAAFRLLTDNTVPTRELLPGIGMAAVGWGVLQAVGGVYIAHVVRNSQDTYGTFATVIGLLVWLYLGARIVVYSAEINVVLTRRLWPRSLFEPPTPADRMARAELAKIQERDDRQTIDVIFHPPRKDDGEPADAPPYSVAPAPAPGEDAAPAGEPAPVLTPRDDDATR